MRLLRVAASPHTGMELAQVSRSVIDVVSGVLRLEIKRRLAAVDVERH